MYKFQTSQGPDNRASAPRSRCRRHRREGNGEVVSPPQPSRGSGERRKLPSGVQAKPGRKRVLAHFRPCKNTPERKKSIIFERQT